MVTLPDRYPPGGGGAWAYVGDTAPMYPGSGMLWYDTSDSTLKVWASGQWNPAMPGGSTGSLTPGWVLAGTPPNPAVVL